MGSEKKIQLLRIIIIVRFNKCHMLGSKIVGFPQLHLAVSTNLLQQLPQQCDIQHILSRGSRSSYHRHQVPIARIHLYNSFLNMIQQYMHRTLIFEIQTKSINIRTQISFTSFSKLEVQTIQFRDPVLRSRSRYSGGSFILFRRCVPSRSRFCCPNFQWLANRSRT